MSSPFTVGPDWLQNSNLISGAGNFARNELLGVDDFTNAYRHYNEGSYGRSLLSLATGVGEVGLTGLAVLGTPFTGGASMAGRVAVSGGRAAAGQALRNAPRGFFRALNPFRGTIAGGRARAGVMQAGRYFAGQGDGDAAVEEEAAAAEDPTAPLAPFTMDFGPGAGGSGGGGGASALSRSYLEQLMPISDYENLLANQLDQISARASAFSVASGDSWDRVQTSNRLAAQKAIQMGAEFGETGRQRWHDAAEGALNIAAARADAIGTMSGGLPQGLSPSAVTEDFAQFAQATGDAEQSLQEGLGQMRGADLDWMAENAGQMGSGYAAEFARAEQDLTASAVNTHNNRVIERNSQIAQMQFASAMQAQQLNAQASLSAANRGAAKHQDVYNLAANLRSRNAGVGVDANAAASMLLQTFPNVFGSVGDALAFYNQLGQNPIE